MIGVGLLVWLGSRRPASTSTWMAAIGTALAVSPAFAAISVWNPIALL